MKECPECGITYNEDAPLNVRAREMEMEIECPMCNTMAQVGRLTRLQMLETFENIVGP